LELRRSLGEQTWKIIRYDVRETWAYVRKNHSLFLVLVSAITFVIGVTLDMVNIPAQTLMQEQAPEEE